MEVDNAEAGEPRHEPSHKFNCWDGYRVSVKKGLQDGVIGDLVSLDVYSDGKLVLFHNVSWFPETVQGRAACNRLIMVLSAIAGFFNCAGEHDVLESVVKGLFDLTMQAKITLPPGWVFYDIRGESTVEDHQYLFLNEQTETVLIVNPDNSVDELPLESLADVPEEKE